MGSIEVGSVVQLKSGGPMMTIVDIIGSDADCTWFRNYKEYLGLESPVEGHEPVKQVDQYAEVENHSFPLAALKVVENG